MQGLPGLNGIPGEMGFQGSPGIQGPPGDRGSKGERGVCNTSCIFPREISRGPPGLKVRSFLSPFFCYLGFILIFALWCFLSYIFLSTLNIDYYF